MAGYYGTNARLGGVFGSQSLPVTNRVAFSRRTPSLWHFFARPSAAGDNPRSADFTKPESPIAARNGSRCREIRHAILAPMQCKPRVPVKSISQLLALFMRQAAVETAAKRAEMRRDMPVRGTKT
jgi:hypothetical protein